MKSARDSHDEQKQARQDGEQSAERMQELIRATHDLIEQSQNNLRTLEKLIKQKDKH